MTIERLLFGASVLFLGFQAYNFLREEGLKHPAGQRLFWMFFCLACLIISFIIKVNKEMSKMKTENQEESQKVVDENGEEMAQNTRAASRMRSRSPLLRRLGRSRSIRSINS